MDRQQSPIMAHKFHAVLDADVLNARGQQRGLAKRARLSTPLRMGLSGLASTASQQVQSIADVHRQFNAWWACELDDNACSLPRLTSRSPAFFRASLWHIMRQLTMKVLGVEAGEALRACNRLLRHDGSSFALHKALAEVFPGRCNAVSPAAVALHGTVDVLHDAPITMARSPETDAAHDSRPAPERLRGEVFLAARGALALTSLRDIDRHGGCCMVRSTSHLPPRVIDAYREDGQRITSCHDRDVQAITSQFPTPQRAELAVEGRIEGAPFRGRLMVRWPPETTCFDDLCTNLPQDSDAIRRICLGDKRRWHGELLLQAWKSSTNLQTFDPEKATMCEAVIWASLAAAALKRFLAHAAAPLLAVVLSTRKASMPSASDVPKLFRALRYGDGPWYRRAFKAMIHSLGRNATRAHPERDARTGRARLGRKPIFQLSDQPSLTDHGEQPVAA